MDLPRFDPLMLAVRQGMPIAPEAKRAPVKSSIKEMRAAKEPITELDIWTAKARKQMEDMALQLNGFTGQFIPGTPQNNMRRWNARRDERPWDLSTIGDALRGR